MNIFKRLYNWAPNMGGIKDAFKACITGCLKKYSFK